MMASGSPSGRVPDATQPAREVETSCNVKRMPERHAQAQRPLEPHFQSLWEQLSLDVVNKRAWKVDSFDSLTSLDAYSEDIRQCPVEAERIRMKHRRDAALRLRSNPEHWSRLALDALRELATDSPGPAVTTLRQSRLLDAFKDFAIHTRYFQLTKSMMESAGIAVFVAGNASSSVHDIDKLDPIMLAGYSERWEDGKDTALWHVCLDSHFSLNTHHQQHELWHTEDSDDKERERWKALPEMLCDKASRKLQKELNGIVSPDMWSMDMKFYSGMPEVWLQRTIRMAEQLAETTSEKSSGTDT
ncbi:hypothetical protein HPB50_004982 [Hyalomma asiaticum]|uniref:Uncharacterized protein n=1 Tax=Hyalomma asiaticum TaxID=266040 RepID=A0ACB7RKE4_HYAAI|nr:hypothetical protein HPB50_004982 [Hyalomma asiaticum]